MGEAPRSHTQGRARKRPGSGKLRPTGSRQVSRALHGGSWPTFLGPRWARCVHGPHPAYSGPLKAGLPSCSFNWLHDSGLLSIIRSTQHLRPVSLRMLSFTVCIPNPGTTEGCPWSGARNTACASSGPEPPGTRSWVLALTQNQQEIQEGRFH